MAKQIIIKGTPVVAANEVLVADSNSKIPAVDGSLVTTMAGGNIAGTIPTARLDTGTTANKLVVLDGSGKIPAVDGSLLTGVSTSTKSASDPTISTNPSGGVGTEWINTSSGKQFICTDATAGENVWTCSGGGSDDIAPPSWYGTRGCWFGGHHPTVNTIDYVTIATLGNAVDFGDLMGVKRGVAGFGNGSGGRGCSVGGSHDSGQGNTPSYPGVEYITFATTGNATLFGMLVVGAYVPGDGGNGVRGVKIGGEGGSPYYNPSIDYVTIANTGNATDFGDMLVAGARSSGTMDGTYCRYGGIWSSPSPGLINNIESITVATTGNATDWADMTTTRYSSAVVSSDAGRGVWGGGYSPGHINVMDYITIATQANAIDFGDLTNIAGDNAGVSNGPRGVFQLGYAGPPVSNRIDYITIATVGNAADFGDLSVSRAMSGACAGD